MRLRTRRRIMTAAAGLMLWHAGGSGAQPILETELDAQVTNDGLHRVDPSIMDAAWVRPDLDLGRYTRILFMPTVVSFRDLGNRNYNVRSIVGVTEFPVSDAMRARLRALFGETFYADLAEVQPYEMNTGVGRDVLMVQGFLVDVISGVPPYLAGASVQFIRRPWEVTVVLELRDSMSNDVLARTIDRQRVDGAVEWSEIPEVTRRAVERWSLLLCRHLEELSDLRGS